MDEFDWTDIQWKLSMENPNDFVPQGAVPERFDAESLCVQQIVEADERIAHLEDCVTHYRELALMALERIQQMRAYILTLEGRVERRRGD